MPEKSELKNFWKWQNFCKNFLNNDIVEINLKAYHLLPTKRLLPGNLMPPVILKFVQLHVKDKLYNLRRLLKANSTNNRYTANSVKGKMMYINERLPHTESLIKIAADR